MGLSEATATILAAIIGVIATFSGIVITRYLDNRKSKQKELELKEGFSNEIKQLKANTAEEVDSKIEDKIKVFEPLTDGSYNKEFYKHFNIKIKEAKEVIYITGEGFDFKTSEGIEIAKEFHESFLDALSRKVEVVRVQIKENHSKEWAEMVSELLKRYHPRFRFFWLQKGKKAQISSICVIDPDHPIKNVSELMLSTTKIKGLNKNSIAGTGVFIEGKDKLATSFRTGILSLIEDSIELKNEADVKKYLLQKEDNVGSSSDVNQLEEQNSHLYFAYGSNMDTNQMKQRCPSAKKVGIGRLEDFDIVFNRKGSYRPGGVASVESANGREVYGIIWQIDSNDLSKLDEIEDPVAYDRKVFKIEDINDSEKKYECYVYIAKPEGEFEPDKDYFKLLSKAAKTANLPEEYLKRLELYNTN